MRQFLERFLSMKNSLVYGKNYFENYGNSCLSYNEQVNNPTFNKRLNELKTLGVIKGKILDIGCAYGYFLRACENRGFTTYGVDISEYAVKTAKKVCKAQLRVLDVQKSKIPLKSSSIDAIFLMDVLEHMENPYALLREVFRLLKKGGIVYIHIPVINRAIPDKTHKTFLNISTLQKVLSFFPSKIIKIGEEGGRFSNYLAVVRLILYKNTYFNYVPEGYGSHISAYIKKF